MLCYIVLLLTLSSVLSEGEMEPLNTHEVPCHYRNLTTSLNDTIHLSDVVLQGHILSSRPGEFGTYTARVSYSYAYKHDGQLSRPSWTSIDIVNFPFDPTKPEYDGGNAVFFLIRQQNTDLALYCMSSLKALRSNYDDHFAHVSNLLSNIRKIGTNDNIKNSNQEQLYPDPCDDNSGNKCSAQGSECSVGNTLSNRTRRCTCVTGFQGDGEKCEALTPEAEFAFCDECGLYQRCVKSPDNTKNEEGRKWTTGCSCSHFNCPTEPASHQKICGNDGHTYSSLCHMRKASCLSHQLIYLLHSGKCQENVIKPCHGLTNPLSTSTGLVTCKNLQCPPMHFCHSTTIYAVCCPVSTSLTPPTNIVTTPTDDGDDSGDGSGDGSGSGFSDNEGSGNDDNQEDDEDSNS